MIHLGFIFPWGLKWSEVAQSCPTLCDPMDCSLPGSSVHGIFQARELEWVAISFSRGSSWPRDRTQVSCIVGRRFTVWATREVHEVQEEFFLLPKDGRWFQHPLMRRPSPRHWIYSAPLSKTSAPSLRGSVCLHRSVPVPRVSTSVTTILSWFLQLYSYVSKPNWVISPTLQLPYLKKMYFSKRLSHPPE